MKCVFDYSQTLHYASILGRFQIQGTLHADNILRYVRRLSDCFADDDVYVFVERNVSQPYVKVIKERFNLVLVAAMPLKQRP